MNRTQPRMEGAGTGYLNSKAMVIGLAVLTTGFLVGACGMITGGTAMAKSLRRWIIAQRPGSVMAGQRAAPADRSTGTDGSGARKSEMVAPSAAR